jgi:putative PIN family toxin of toxin-antitoxin system
MIRVVIDTNVVVSANLVDEGPSAAILSLAISKKIMMFVSPAVLAEYEKVLSRPRLKFDPGRVKAVLTIIRDAAELVQPTRTIKEIEKDEPDNRFLECADAARAEYIVTGNPKHFPQTFENITIVTPREFLEIVVPRLALEGNDQAEPLS